MMENGAIFVSRGKPLGTGTYTWTVRWEAMVVAWELDWRYMEEEEWY